MVNTTEKLKEKVYTVRTVYPCTAHLCGYDFRFDNEIVKKDGADIKQGKVYKLSSKKYKHLDEIVTKLTNPKNEIVRIVGESEE